MLSENKKIVLAKGISNGGYIRVEDINHIYSTRDAAHSAIMSLVFGGWIKETDTIGVFHVTKAPQESFDMANNVAVNKEGGINYGRQRTDGEIKKASEEEGEET